MRLGDSRSDSASVLFHGFRSTVQTYLLTSISGPQFDRPLRKNVAIDEELAELDALHAKVSTQHRSQTAAQGFDQERGAASAEKRGVGKGGDTPRLASD
jgi:hypothetical protein